MIQDHLKDIDFRTREERQKENLQVFIDWYNQLQEYLNEQGWDERIEGQLMMLSSVLWYLLPEKEFKRLTKIKP